MMHGLNLQLRAILGFLSASVIVAAVLVPLRVGDFRAPVLISRHALASGSPVGDAKEPWASALRLIGETRELDIAQSEAGQPVGWRNDGSGYFSECKPPIVWSESQQLWKAALPATSLSSPAVVGKYVLTMVEPTELICADGSDGKILWQRSHNYADFYPAKRVREIEKQHQSAKKVREQIEGLQKQLKEAQARKDDADKIKQIEAQIAALNEQYEKQTPFPPPSTDTTGNTTSTPLSDGQSVWCVFATGIVSSHDLQGERKWMDFIEKPPPRHTSSPIMVGDRLIVHLTNLIALDANSGRVLWTTESPVRMGTSIAMPVRNGDVIVTPAGSVIRASDGKLQAEKLFDLPYCSPIGHEGVVYAVERGKIKAIRLNESADGNIGVETLWETRGAEGDQLASPVVHQGLLYTITGNGILDVIDTESGKRVYRKRLDLGQGRIDASLALAGETLFVSSTSGKTLAFVPGRTFEELGHTELEGSSSSPFFCGTRVYVRTPKHLFCIGK